jgi:hypothetical protein
VLGRTPAEVVEAEVLITILPGTQELNDVMLIPAAREDQLRPGSD